jgi:branched-chain amino acid transport system substrate-binding protein
MSALSLLLLSIFLFACGEEKLPSPAEKRAAALAQVTGDIKVGVSWMWAKELDLMRQGLEMAADEINQEGINGRHLNLVWSDDEEDVERGLKVARDFIADADLGIVIGHSTSSITLKAAPLYQEAGILLLAPGATHPSLTAQGNPLVFRTIPSDANAGLQLANFASQQAFQRVGLCYIDNEYGRALTKIFTEKKFGELQIIESLSYSPEEDVDFSEVFASWKDLNLDAIFLVATMPQAAHVVSQAHSAGLKIPIIGADGLDSPELAQIAGTAAEGVIAFSVFHPGAPRPAVRSFSKNFKKRYNHDPDVWAALGYDTLKILAAAIAQADNSSPSQIATALRQLKGWSGATGPLAFGSNGELKYKPIVSKIIQQGHFKPLEEGMLR